MKICVINTQIFALGHRGLLGYGGLEQIAWECAKGLAAKGHDVTLIAPQGTICPGCDVFECLPPGCGDERAAYGGCVYNDANGNQVQWPGYWNKLLEFNDGIVIDHTWQKWSAMLRAEGRLKARILGTLHAPSNTMYGSIPPEGVLSFVCISDDQKAHFEALHSPREARRVYNGIDTSFYRPIEMPRSNRFLFLARFSTIKGADISLKVCKEAGVGLDLIGDRQITGEPQYYDYCCSLADGEKLKIIGGVPRGETVWWYSQAEALLHLNQRFREPFGLAPVEAMACGCPVIGWDFGAMRETIRHGETGFLVKSEKEAVDVLKSGAFDKLDRNRCREWASQFSIQNMILGYEDLCQRALDGEVW